MEPNTDANEMPVDIWARADAAMSAWEKQEAAREFQRQFDQNARAEAAFRQLQQAREARRKALREEWTTWLIFAAVAAAVIWGICVGGFQ